MTDHWVKIARVQPGVGKEDGGKSVGGTSASGDVGVLVLGVRDDALSTLSEAEGQFTSVKLDSEGRLWVRTGEVRQTMILSGSVDGQPIPISVSPTTIHTPPSGTSTFDQVFLWVSNTSSAQREVTILFGGSSSSHQIKMLIPSKDTSLVLAGPPIRGSLSITAIADGTGCNAVGYVERVTT